MKRVLVTGGTGFIGACVVKKIREQGEVVDILGHGPLAGVRLGQTIPLPEALSKMPKYDAVVHLAAHIGDSSESIVASNFHGIHDVLDYCNANNVDRLIHMSRSFVVRQPGGNASSSRLRRLYEYSKYYAELLLHEQSRVATRILRITAPIWHTMPKERFLSQILLSIADGRTVKIYGQGRRRQNYVRVDDIADAVSIAMSDSEAGSLVRNYWVVGPENFTDFELVQTVCERLGVPFSYEFVVPPDGQTVDESDYGIDTTCCADECLPSTSRPIDAHMLRAHMNVLTANRN